MEARYERSSPRATTPNMHSMIAIAAVYWQVREVFMRSRSCGMELLMREHMRSFAMLATLFVARLGFEQLLRGAARQ